MELVSKNIRNNNQEEQLIRAMERSFPISITDSKFNITYVNDKFCDISGYHETELLGKSLITLSADKQQEHLFEDIYSLISTNGVWKGDICNTKKDQSLYWANTTIIPLADDFGTIENYVSIYFDIAKSEARNINLKRIQNSFKVIFDSTPYSYFITDLKGQIIYCNTATETLSGYHKNELLNKKITDLKLLNKTDRTFFTKTLKIASKKPHKCEFQITSKKGQKIEIEVISHYFVNEGEPLVLNIAQNITTRKNTLKKLEDKTKDLELLLYRSGHDLRTPFTSLEGLLNLMKLEPHNQNTSELIKMFETVLNNGKILVDDLSTSSLMLAKNIKKVEVDLNQLVTQTLNNLNHLNGYETICFNINIPKVFKFISNPQLLGSILQNLLQNAIKYHRPFTNSHTPFIIINAFKIDNGVKISIKDNGKGIKKDELDKVFNLYYKSNTSETGTGLGLYITKNIVEQLNGVIRVKSIIDKETQFDIELPNIPL